VTLQFFPKRERPADFHISIASQRRLTQGVAVLAVACGALIFTLSATLLSAAPAAAADRLRLAVQKTGTFAWELAIIKEHGLDKKANLDLEVTELASTEAEKIAIRGASADLILSDWLWVSRERSLGTKLTFYPYSSALGAVMVAKSSPVQTLADLKSKKIAVAGGPLDKSWLLLQALSKRSNFDLKTETQVLYGAPPLLSAKLTQGEVDATLNFWNFCVGLESQGYRRLVSMDDVQEKLGAKEPVPMVGYVFNEAFVKDHPGLIERFLKIAREAKAILAQSDDEWKKLGPQIGIKSEAELALYRKRYLDGIPHRPVEDDITDAKLLYKILAEIGGQDLVGPSPDLVEGTFYKPQADL